MSFAVADREPTPFRHVDVVVPLFTMAIAVIGVIVIYSATRGPATDFQPPDRSFLVRQAAFVVIGVGLMAATAWFGHRRARAMTGVLYVGFVVSLLAVAQFGVLRNDTRAWFRFGGLQIQPSEFGKIVLILALAAWWGSDEELDIRRLASGLGILAVPLGLIVLQPDLGTALVYGAITVGIVLVAGTQAKHLLVLGLLAITGFVAVLNSDVLSEYQVDRLLVFLSDDDAAGLEEERFNLEQSQIAIGNGGLRGQGLFQGSQTNSNLVPEQETDFIMTVVGEELGFIGSSALLGLFALLLSRIWRIAQLAEDRFAVLICVGVFSMLLFQIFQSVGMTVGIMPVTGIPLPLVSYGGSSAFTTFVGLGLVESVHMRRYL